MDNLVCNKRLDFFVLTEWKYIEKGGSAKAGLVCKRTVHPIKSKELAIGPPSY
jgi:hypothetical protein